MFRLLANLCMSVVILCVPLSFAHADDWSADVQTIDSIINAYYDVVSGPEGHVYNVVRDEFLHAPNAIITRVDAVNPLQRHDLATEQQALQAPYPEGFFELEIGRVVESYGGLAQVWSSYEIRSTPDGKANARGINSVSLYYDQNRWWIASWSTQLEGEEALPEKYLQLP